MKKIRFTVAISAYNIETYVKRAIDSVLNQTFTNYELLVIDDCSKDNTVQIIEEALSGKGIILKTIKNSGTAAASRNIAIDNAQGEYLLFLDGDDELYSKDTLKEVVELRNSTYDKMSDEEKIKTNEQLSSGINKIMALAEAYPDLKANENFKDLSKQLTKVEDDITNSRKYYNGVVRIYNNKVEMFPSNIFAGLFGYKSKAMFEASANERENVKVEL